MRGLAKWRRKTVDFADDMFMDVAVAFGAPDTRPKTEKKKKKKSNKLHQSLQPQARLSLVAQIKRTDIKVTTAEPVQTTVPAATLTPATPVGKASTDMPGLYRN